MSLISTMIKTHKADRLSQEAIKKLQDKRLKKLVAYARENSSYFKELYTDVGDDFNLDYEKNRSVYEQYRKCWSHDRW